MAQGGNWHRELFDRHAHFALRQVHFGTSMRAIVEVDTAQLPDQENTGRS
jgi:hypothetical protein